ncbi:Type III restriction enzyme, res subunit [Gemmata sp. SH-PL17]|uniref:type I-G CRISPR-associated helicase/endonuclease Cas3g n=1 Tax=Gemmata sp. SH-PL17 TaxID=1630693 RepID=UPI00078E9EA4|nr:type I-U CRISPR-associated helicase/endonuclease Cas3 [Gemmata sp. SH-PL17]AMV26060.1 Type III restriction enzyme, res subunit [Gemmata sp. SH-PL17]
MADINFDAAFEALTGNAPFPWQRALYERFTADRKDNIPESCNLPTGLGKTSVIAVWLIALATHPTKMPRRLVYVVNRRTVVDQTTDEVVKIRKRLPEAPQIQDALWELCAVRPDKPDPENDRPLAISTLRGQFADNREWSADPSRPAVICGTVDMIGSRLLFSGYGCGFRTRPLHAGFLGQDSLIVHDEAHLEPAFQELLIAIKKEQHEGRTPDFRPLKVMELTATSRAGGAEPFGLTDPDYKNGTVQKRIGAKKALHLHENKDEKKLADEIADLALKYKDSGRAILVFVRKVEDVEKIVARLNKEKQHPQQLTGTLRGYERDTLPRDEVFARFLPNSNRPEGVKPAEGTVYLVCTSAGEVGVNISADHLVCDLSTFESMTQRFGRVNRFGDRTDTEIHVIHPKTFAGEDKFASPLKLTLGLLELLNGDASPSALTALRELAIKEGSGAQPPSSDRIQALRDYVNANQGADPRLGGFAPQPLMLPTSDILFDAWALTTVHELPGRPPVAEYLHGVEDEKNRETHVAWREEVNLFSGTGVNELQIAELLDTFPLKPHEMLRDSTWRVQDELSALSGARADLSVWVIDPDDEVRVLELGELAKRDNKKKYIQNLIGCTVVLPPTAGGLTSTGTLDSKADRDSERKYDVAGSVQLASGVPLVRLKVTLREGELVYELVAPVRELGTEFVRLPENVTRWEEARTIRTRCREVGLPPMRVAYRLDLRTSEDDLDGLLEYLVLKPESGKKLALQRGFR